MAAALSLLSIFSIILFCQMSIGATELCSAPIAWVLGTNKNTKEVVKLFFSNDSSAEIVLRDLSNVSVHCEAEYSTQLDFEGYADFKFLAAGSGSSSQTLSNETTVTVVQRHMTYIHLLSLMEVYTGLYTCRGRSSQTKNNAISAYIFVPTNKLFVSARAGKLSSSAEGPLLVPCPVAEPLAVANLMKLENGDTTVPITSAVYNPRRGFLLNKSDDNQAKLEGSYFCIAQHNGSRQAVEFTVVSGPVKCDKKCEENAECELLNERQVCQCKKTFEETLVSEKCLRPCTGNENCPKNLACLPQTTDSFLLDLLVDSGRSANAKGACKNPCVFANINCSIDSKCRVENNIPTCIPK